MLQQHMIVCLIEESKNQACLSSSNRSSEGDNPAWLPTWAAAAATNTIEEQVARKQPGNGKSQAYNAAVELGLKDWNLLHLLVSFVDALLTKRVDLTLSPVDEIMKKTQNYVDQTYAQFLLPLLLTAIPNREKQRLSMGQQAMALLTKPPQLIQRGGGEQKAHNSNLAVARTVIAIEEQEANTKRACNLK
jgi:hypothetical protein